MNPRRASAALIGGAAALALAVLCWCGVYVRYKADDFWTASVVARHGFWRSQTWWYQRWSGRFAYTFLIGVVEKIGPAIVPALVAIVIAAWVAATYALVKNLPLALVFVFAAAAGTPDVPQSILWQTGLVTYVVPIAGLTAWLATTIGRDSLRWYDAAAPFVLAGFSEANTLAQIIVLAALVAVFRKRTFSAALGGSIVALVIVALSPGNGVRMSLYAEHSIAWAAGQAIAGSGMFLLSEITQSGMVLLTIFIAAMLLAPRIERRIALAAIAVAICVAIVTYAVSLKALGLAPPERTLIVPHVFLVVAIAAAGSAIRVAMERFAPALIVVALVAPLIFAVQRARDIPDAAAFARAWDRLDADLRRNAGNEVVVANAPGSAGTLAFITHSRDAWSNRCIADYYSLGGIAAAPPDRSAGAKRFENFPVYAVEGPRRHDDHHVVRLRFTSD